MFNFKKKLAVALSGVLTLAMLAPAAVVPSVAKAADKIALEDIGVESVSADAIIFTGNKLYVDTVVNGKVKSTEVYKTTVDLSYLNGKDAELVLYAEAPRTDATQKVTVKIAAQPKITAKYNPETGVVDVKNGGVDVPADSFDIYVGADKHLGENLTGGKGYTKEQYDVFLKKGVTGYAVLKESGELDVKNTTDLSASGATISITPVSKKAKFKIPAMAKAPKVTIDVNTISFKLPKGCSYSLLDKENKEVASGAATDKATVVDIVDVASKKEVLLTQQALTLEVKKDKTAKKPASKTLEVVVPQQPEMKEADISSKGLIYCEPAYNAKKTVQTGIKINNVTSSAMQVAVVADIAKVDIVNGKGADKVKWKTVKANKSINIPAKQVKDKYVIYRMAGVKKSKNTGMQLASNWVCDKELGKVVIEEAIKPTLTVTVSKIADKSEGDVTSPCTITVTVKDGNGVFYTVETKQKKDVLPIGSTAKDLNAKEIKSQEGNYYLPGADVKGKFVAIYEVDSTGKVVAYGCATTKVE